MSDTGPSGTSGGVSDSDGGLVRRRSNTDGGGDASATSGAVSRASGDTGTTCAAAPTTTISTIAVQSGGTRIVLALLQSGDWLELRVVELSPGLVYLGSTLEEAIALQQAHHEVLTKLQSKQSPVEDLLNQADQLISTQRPRAEVYAAMAESLGFAWRDLNIHLETRKNLLDLSVAFHTRARQYSDALDAAEKTYTDNVMPSDVDGARALLVSLHDHKRAILEASMFTLQEAQVLLGKLKGLLQEGGSMDSRPQHIRTNIEFACSQIEHYLESLHDRRRFLDGLFIARKHHLEQCVTLCILYQDLTEAILNLKKLRDEISEHQELGVSQANAEILLHEHLRRENAAKAQQDQCVRHVRTTEQMVASGHYAGAEARARAYSVLEAATALHETCDTRTALLQQSALFFRLANGALTKLDQAEVQIAALSSGEGGNQRLSVVMGVVEEAVQPALTEGYALLEVTGGRGQPHNEGVTQMVEQLENRRTRLSSLCADSTEKVLQRTELINSFLEMYNAIESWLVKIGDSFLRGHQDPGGSLSLAKDFLHLHLTLKNDLMDKEQEIITLSAFLDQLSKELSGNELPGYKEKVEGIKHHWASLRDILDSRIAMSEKYVKFHEDSEQIYNQFEELEGLLKSARSEADNVPIEQKWKKIQDMYRDLDVSGKEFIKMTKKCEYPYLDVNRAILCIEYVLENLGKRKLVVTDLFTHYQKKVLVNKELSTLWNTYRENLKKMELEMYNLEDNLCPLLRGDSSNPEGLGSSLEKRLNNYVKSLKKIQEEIENMVTKAEGLAHSDAAGAERPDIVRALLQLYQNLQNKVTDYQILGTMLIQWCNNIAEVHRSCDKLEKQFGTISIDVGGVERQLKEHEASKHAVTELLKFAQHEADAIIQKIMAQCPHEPGSQDIAKMKEMLERRKEVMEYSWKERQVILEKQLKRSQYQIDLKVIRDQLRDLSDQLGRMKGHYGDSLNAALNMKTAFIQFKMTVETLGRRIDNFVSTAEKMLLGDDDAKEIQLELCDLQNKWSTFHMQVGESQKSIDLSIEFFKLVKETESWFKEGSQLLVTVAGESSHIQSPEEARKLQQKIESFLTPGEIDQANRITKITSLAVLLYGDTTPQQVEAVSQQNEYMLDSFNVINKNLVTLMKNLKEAEEQRQNQEKEQQELAASLAQAQSEAENSRLAALAAEEARRIAEETVTAMAMHKIPSETVEVIVQTEEVSGPETVTFEEFEKKVTMVQEEEILRIPPMFLTPLVGATVSEGVKFTFECRVTGDPVPEVVWLKDGLSIMNNPDYKTSFDGKVCTLTIEETFTEDSALFTCRAKNVVGKAESSANLLVKEAVPTEIMSPPVFTKSLVDVTPQEGSTLQLEATVTGHPLPVVSWAKNGICIDNSPDYNLVYNNGECVLRFEELFLEDSAEYTCRATNDLGDDMTKGRVTVLAKVASEPPSFAVPLSNLMARAGQKFKLECEVRGTPTPTLAWFHNNKPVKETPDCRISFDGSRATLVISEAFPKNAGKYTLVAKNTAGEAQTSSNVSVKGRIPTETSDSEITSDIDAEPVKPSIQQSLKDISAKEGEAIRLDCIIIGQPEPEVIWYHDDKPVKESEDIRLLFHGDRCSLVIHEALMEDVGTYKVVAMNSAGEASTSCFVNVLAPEKPASPVPEVEVPSVPSAPLAEPPRFSLLLVDSHVLEGGSTSLSASVSGSPKPTIAWFRDGVPLLPDDQLQIYEEPDGYAKIYIPHANLDHTGQYEVVASNSAGTAKCVGFLSIEPRLPSPPAPEPQEPPVFYKLLKDTSIQSGEAVLFEADVNGVPKPSVYWTLNESPVNEYEYLHGVKQYTVAEDEPGKHTLRIACSTRGQDGRVAIVAENEAGRAVSSCRLHVSDPPAPTPPVVSEGFERRIVVSETHVTKFVSSSVNDDVPSQHSFAASSTSRVSSSTGQPTVQVHGSLVQQLDQEGSAPPEVTEKVNLIKLEGEKVVEQVSKDSSTVQVASPSLAKKPVKRRSAPACFIAPLQGVILKENEKAVFECVIDGYPEPSIEWSHNRGSLPEDAVTGSQGNRVSLVIPRVSQSHGGRYTCTIENDAGTAQCTCDLVVRKIQFPPVFSKRLQPSVIGVGERLHLEIDVSGTPTPQVSWSKNGQPLQSNDSLTIKTEGTRSWLVIPEAQESDSGRYGVTASNGAGRSECLADVMVTSLTICEPTKTIVFTDVSDDSRSQAVIVESGHVKTLKKVIESSSTENEAPLIPVSFSKVVTNPPEQLTTSIDFATPVATSLPSEPELPEEKLERKLPGKLRLSWPPPPSDDEDDLTQKTDIVTQHKVTDIISSFSALSESEPEPKVPTVAERAVFVGKAEAKVWEPSLIPEPQPQYGYIESAPLLYNPQEEVLSSSELETFDGEFSDNVLSTPATSDYYPKTSPSVEVDNLEKFQQISEEPEISQNIIQEVPSEPPTEHDDMEVRTERHSRESSFTEIKKSMSTSEKTIIETKIYRDYPKEGEVIETVEVTPTSKSEEIIEHVVAPVSEEIIEFQPVTVHEAHTSNQMEFEDIPSKSEASKQSEKTPLVSHSFSSSEKNSSFSTQESHASYISSSQIETKVYPKSFGNVHEVHHSTGVTQTSDVFRPTQESLCYEKQFAEELTSGDEHSMPCSSQDRKGKKKRESVKQIALRLEESIMPISPDEVPGGIRMFPPKPPTPSIETTQPEFAPKDVHITSESDAEDKIKINFKDFPELQPFPFTVEKKPTVERPKLPPPPKPKKFIPGSFTDSEYDSDFDVPIGERFVPKKIKFEAKDVEKSNISFSKEEPPPPSVFDKPPLVEGMRPEILKEDIKIEKETILPKKEIAKKKPNIVQKFMDKAASQVEGEISKPMPPTTSLPPKTQSETYKFVKETKKTEVVANESVIMESRSVTETAKPIPKKLEKAWPPPQEPVVSPAIKELDSLKLTSMNGSLGELQHDVIVPEIKTSETLLKETKREESYQMAPAIQPKVIETPKKPEPKIEVKPPQPMFVPPPSQPQLPPEPLSQGTQTMTFSKETSMQTQASFQGFKSVKPPSLSVAKEKPMPSRVLAPTPPFDMKVPTEVAIPKPVPTMQAIPKPATPQQPAKETTFSSFKSENKSFSEKKYFSSHETKQQSLTINNKPSKAWPPKEKDVQVAAAPWIEPRSQSLERPPVTTAPTFPHVPHEAPPAIYWSSNVTLKEKRNSLPLKLAETSFKSISEQNLSYQKSWQEIQQQTQSVVRSAQFEASPTPKHVRIDESAILPQKLKSSLIAQRRPTPAPPKVVPDLTLIEKMTVEPIASFKPIPDLEPFPFEAPQKKDKPRQHLPPPPKPKKFIPGSFTESDYESDYEGKPPSVWRPYMSDTETTEYKPIKVKLKQGRHRRPKGPSPPAPTEFDTPPQVNEPLRPTVSLTDLEPTKTYAREVLQMTPLKCKFTKKSSSKSKVVPLVKPVPIKPAPPHSAPQLPFVQQTLPVIAPVQATFPVTPVIPTPIKREAEIAYSQQSTSQVESKVTTGVRSLRDKFQAHPLGEESVVASSSVTRPHARASSPSSSPSPMRGSTTTQKHVSFKKQEHKAATHSKVLGPTPIATTSAESTIIPFTHELPISKPLSPKLRHKMEVINMSQIPKEFEESGYAADTESTLPRKVAKSQNYHETAGMSSHYSKTESHSSTSKSHTGAFQSSQTSTGSAFTGFPGDSSGFSEFSGFGGFGGSGGGGFPPNGGLPGSFSFPSQPFPSFDQSANVSSSFTSSESKSSQYYSSTKTEEFYEKRTESDEPDVKKREEKSQHERRKPKFEEFRRDTRGTPSAHGPFSEDTFYSMSDESEVMTDKGKKKSKVEMKTESHVQVMSDKKSEYYSYSSGGETDKTKKDSPKSKKKRSFKTTDTIQQIKTPTPSVYATDQIKTPTPTTPKHERKIEIQLSQEEAKPKPKLVTSSSLEKKVKSFDLVKKEVTRHEMEKDLDLKPFPFKPEAEKPKKQRGPPPPQPKKFVKGEFHESDYGSDYDSKILPVWKGPESDVEEPSYSKVEIPKVERRMFRQQRSPTPPSKYDPYPKFDDTPRPVIEFPDSEPEVKEIIPTPIPKIVKKKPDMPKIVPKQETIVSRAPQPTKYERPSSPVLQREPSPELGYIKPQPKHTPFSNAVGVESTKITKIEDSSQYHKRFVTMEHTTRVIKLSDSQTTETPKKPKVFEDIRKHSKKTKIKPEDTYKYESQEKLERVAVEVPSIQMKPMPKLEPFPFTPDPPKPRKDRGSPPPTPKKFIKGEMRDSEYDSDSDLLIKPKWHPPDSDVDEPVYGKVIVPESPKLIRKPTKANERTPTPPSVFDKPPPLGEPMRPHIESVEFVIEKEPSPDYVMPIEVSLVDEKTLARNLVFKEQSPPLPPPGTPPEEGIIVKKTEYVVDGINIETKTAPPTMKAIPTVKKKPFREIIEKTERKITDKQFTEERTFKTGKIEIIKTTVTDLSSDEQEEPKSRKIEMKSSLEDVSHSEYSPYQVERRPFIREKAPSPPQSKRFLKQEIEETTYSDQEQKIPPLWKPHDSDTDEPSYTKIEVSLPTTKKSSRDERTPTPPSKFDKGPPDSVIMRKTSAMSVTKVEDTFSYVEKQSEPKYVQPQAKPKPTKTTEKVEVKKYYEPTLPKPGPKPVIGFIKPEPTIEVPLEPIHKSEPSRKGIDINIDIVDVYDYVSESESERVYSDIGSYKSFPDLEPFPYAPEPPRPKRERGQPPPMPKKFMKGEFKESDYDSETDGRIPPKWGPTDSEGEGLGYRKVKAPSSPMRKLKSDGTGRVPSPPSKFDQPPSFEGPPRPIVDLQDIPRRERRESLEEYSIPKFPKVEFKPFDLQDDENTTKVKLTQTTDTETDTESIFKKTATKKYVESTQKYVGEQFSDMNLNFRDKAQRFAEQLVSEVFATRDGSSKLEHIEQPSHSVDIKPPASEKLREENGLDVEEPQAYRDESRVSEFGSKHIDPDTGLIYFKYDFGYEFGIILPGEGKKVERSRSVPPGKKDGDIEIPVIHIRSDDESNYQKRPRTGIPRRDFYDQYREKTAPKKSGQPKSYGVYSDSESDTRVKKMASTIAGSKGEGSKSLTTWQQALPDQGKGPLYQLSSPSLVSSASAATTPKLPTFITPLKDQSFGPGQEVRLECVVRSNIPPRITWFKDGFPLNGNPRCQTLYRNGVCRLILSHPMPEDSGHYTCSAENAVGESCTSNLVTVNPGESL